MHIIKSILNFSFSNRVPLEVLLGSSTFLANCNWWLFQQKLHLNIARPINIPSHRMSPNRNEVIQKTEC